MSYENLNIAFIRQKYNPFGGAEKVVNRYIEALLHPQTEEYFKLKPKISLITRRWTKHRENQQTLPIEIIETNPPYYGNVWRDYSFLLSTQEVIQKNQYQITQTHERIPGCDIYYAGDGLHCEWLNHRQRILSPQKKLGLKLNPFHYYNTAIEKKLFEDPSLKKVICLSEMIKKEILNHFKIDESKLDVIYNTVDTEIYNINNKDSQRKIIRQNLNISNDQLVFIFVGAGFERKNLKTVIQAFKKLSNQKDIILLIAGTDKKIADYQAFANQKNIRFLGGIKDIQNYYLASDVFILPSIYEPFGVVILEAMACGLPVITSVQSGGAEVIQHEKSGFIADALDIDAMFNFMNFFYQHSDALKTMGTQAYQDALLYSPSRMNQELIQVYQSIL